jgi:hypothetical protein
MGHKRDNNGRYLFDPYDARLPRNSVVTKSSAYTALGGDYCILVNASGGDVTITLPGVTGLSGKEFYIKKTDSSENVVNIDGDGAEQIDGWASINCYQQYDAYHIITDGSSWHIL